MQQALRNIHNKKIKNSSYNNNRNNRSFLRDIVFFLIILTTIICSGWRTLIWMKYFNQLPISKLVITGEHHYSCNDNIIQAILALKIPETSMSTDINKIQNKIKTIPWIRKVTVRKQWPDILNIHLVEHKPYALWNDIFFINADGSVFRSPELLNIKNNFLMLYGPQGSQHEILKMYHVMQEQLTPHNFSIKSLSMTTRHAWKLNLSNGIHLNIGKKDIKGRLNRFIELYPILKQERNKRIRYIDLRYCSAAAVGWLPPSIKSTSTYTP